MGKSLIINNQINFEKYKITKAGIIPKEWQAKRIIDIADLNPNNHVKIPEDTLVSFIPMANISESGYIFSHETRKYSEVKKGYTFFKEGDILIAKITPCFENGKGALACNLLNNIGLGSTEFHVLRVKEFNNQLLFLHTQTYKFRVTGTNNMTGTAGQKRVPTSFIRNYYIPVPSPEEQGKIVTILSIWDQAIDKVEKLIEAKQRLKKGLMQQLLTGQMRFPEYIKSDTKQETMFGLIPTDWKFVPISNVAYQVMNRNVNGGELPVLSCTKYDGLVDSLKYFNKQIFSVDTSTYKVVKRGHFAYATNHIEEGSIGYQDLYDKGLVSPMYTVFKTNEKIDDDFLFCLLKTNLYIHLFSINTSASVNRRGSLRWSKFSKIKIPLPSMDEQSAIVEVLDYCKKDIRMNKDRLEILKNQKQGLMQKLLTGKVRVKV
jgi:type I restriction enzyme S subunit